MWEELQYVLLHEQCPQCGGKMSRARLQQRLPQDENGGEFICTKVQDRCDACHAVLRESSDVPWPCDDLEELFGRWDRQEISREDFDSMLRNRLQRGGGTWRNYA